MSWFETEGRYPHHVIFSQVNYKRNPASMPFVARADKKSLDAIADKIGSLLSKNGFHRDNITESDTVQLYALAEKGYIDRDLLSPSQIRSVYFNEPCSLAISVGGRDMITVRAILSGAAVTDAKNIASGAEEMLDREIEFAYSDPFGYISASPECCGSCAEFSALLYLPSLSQEGDVSSAALRLSRSDVSLTPFYRDGENSGDLYYLTHIPSHLCDEDLTAASLDRLISAVIEEEITRERMKLKEKSKIIADGAWRAYGSLLYCRLLSEGELLSLSSTIRRAMAICDDKSVSLPPVSAVTLNTLLARALNYSLISEGGACTSEEELLSRRAKVVSGILYEKGLI